MRPSPSVAGILLAAGQSKRFGRNKLIEPIDGKPMILSTVNTWLSSPIDLLQVVTGGHQDDIETALSGADIALINNPHFDSGMASSIAAGIASIPSSYDLILIGLADMPYVKADTIKRLIETAARFDPYKKIWVPCHDGQRGNPVLWHRRLAPDLLTLSGDQGGRQLFQRYRDVLTEVAVSDPGILKDIDTPQDLRGPPKKKADQ